MELGVDQVHLAQVGRVGSRSIRERCLTVSPVGVALDAEPRTSWMAGWFGLIIV